MKGDDAHPLDKHLTDKKRGKKIGGDVQWNFQKYVAGVDGKVVARFDPKVDPLSKEFIATVEKELKKVKKGKAKKTD